MTLTRIVRLVYGLFGILYVLVGVGSMLLPTGWLPQHLEGDVLAREVPSKFVEHLPQESGTVVLSRGIINSIPSALMLWLGLLQLRASKRWEVPGAA